MDDDIFIFDLPVFFIAKIKVPEQTIRILSANTGLVSTTDHRGDRCIGLFTDQPLAERFIAAYQMGDVAIVHIDSLEYFDLSLTELELRGYDRILFDPQHDCKRTQSHSIAEVRNSIRRTD